MADERETVTLGTLSRWLILAAIVVIGVTLYFVVGRNATPVVEAPALEEPQ